MRTDDYIFHIDTNNAFLSWTAAYRIFLGDTVDLREQISVIGGDEEKRHGIVLAKSEKAKSLSIKTAMTLSSARKIYPQLIIAKPDYNLYSYYSNAMIDIIREYTDFVEKYSIDECFIKVSTDEPLALANKIKNNIKKELNFTVNIGISTNKVLAKMASDFQKPDKVHTLFPDQIREKMWHLPVSSLFMCGKKTTYKLNKLCIYTIGDLANTNPDILLYHFKSLGETLHKYSNGIDDSKIKNLENQELKGIGNSSTIAFNIENIEEARLVILSLCENVGIRLRREHFFASTISIDIVDEKFKKTSRSKKLDIATNSTKFMYKIAKHLLESIWSKNISIRNFGVRASSLVHSAYLQGNMLEDFDFQKESDIDSCIDKIRDKFGNKSVFRACFISSEIPPTLGKEYKLSHKKDSFFHEISSNINKCT